MNITLELVVSYIFVAVVFIINNSKLIKSIFSNKKDLIGVIDTVKQEFQNEKQLLEAQVIQLNAIVTFLCKEMINNLQERLEITNDTEEAKELTQKIKQYTELFK